MEDTAKSGRKIFYDEDETESEETKEPELTSITTKSRTLPLIKYIYIDSTNAKFKSWEKFFPEKKVDLFKLLFNPNWNDFFTEIDIKKSIVNIEANLSGFMSKSKPEKIVPEPELIFNIFNLLNLSKIKVVILGQDPYQNIGLATGFSFSVPYGVKIPSSLQNIFKNMIKFKHLEKMPQYGCLANWVLQGCFMLNTALTTFVDKSGAHKKVWMDFSKSVIKYINDNTENCVFVSWGKDAFNACAQIDRNKHCVIYSTHPSGLSCSKTGTANLNGEPVALSSFESVDHFGSVNKYLKKHNKSGIIWDLIDTKFA